MIGNIGPDENSAKIHIIFMHRFRSKSPQAAAYMAYVHTDLAGCASSRLQRRGLYTDEDIFSEMVRPVSDDLCSVSPPLHTVGPYIFRQTRGRTT